MKSSGFWNSSDGGIIVGDVVYPEPPEVIVTIPTTPFSILEVAATPAPSPITETTLYFFWC